MGGGCHASLTVLSDPEEMCHRVKKEPRLDLNKTGSATLCVISGKALLQGLIFLICNIRKVGVPALMSANYELREREKARNWR